MTQAWLRCPECSRANEPSYPECSRANGASNSECSRANGPRRAHLGPGPYRRVGVVDCPHDGLRPFHQKSTCVTQSTLGSYAVQIWSRNRQFQVERNPRSPPCDLVWHADVTCCAGDFCDWRADTQWLSIATSQHKSPQEVLKPNLVGF